MNTSTQLPYEVSIKGIIKCVKSTKTGFLQSVPKQMLDEEQTPIADEVKKEVQIHAQSLGANPLATSNILTSFYMSTDYGAQHISPGIKPLSADENTIS